jgi:hypothetical protein
MKIFALVYKIGIILLFFATMGLFLYLIFTGITQINYISGIGGGIAGWVIIRLLPHIERLYKEEKKNDRRK